MIPARVSEAARAPGEQTGWPVMIIGCVGGVLLRAFSAPVSEAALDPRVFLDETATAPHVDLRISNAELAEGGAS